jgi:hypothetical protein
MAHLRRFACSSAAAVLLMCAAHAQPADQIQPGAASPTPPDVQQSMCMLIESAANANALPVEFFARVIWQESRFRPDAVGPMTRRGERALGIAQFMPGTAAERNLLDPLNPVEALPKSAEFLSDLRRQFGNLGLAAAAYNAGPRRVREWLAGSGNMPSETRRYVEAITGASVEAWAHGADPPAQDKGANCSELMAMLKTPPNTFVAALQQRVVTGTMQPWGAILGANRSRDRILARYVSLQHRFADVLTGLDPILIDRRAGPLPRYQIRIGAATRGEANTLCGKIHRSGGDCVVLRNPRG